MAQIKVQKTKDYFVYFEFYELKSWGKNSSAAAGDLISVCENKGAFLTKAMNLLFPEQYSTF